MSRSYRAQAAAGWMFVGILVLAIIGAATLVYLAASFVVGVLS